ncbi:transposase [Nonomuraea sp. KM90]|uniref:transposase n=1 Tax=Nonomuraea sp. KM90 TaxID=3457428 RepID=UPI003FCCF121
MSPYADTGGRYQQRRATFTGLCVACPLHDRCTTAKTGRVVTIRPHHDLQAAARHQAATDPDWQDDYRRWRPMVERAVAWRVARGNRRLRYRGTAANDRWLHYRAAALNLRRLVNLGLTHTNGIWTLVQSPYKQEGEPAHADPPTKIFRTFLAKSDGVPGGAGDGASSPIGAEAAGDGPAQGRGHDDQPVPGGAEMVAGRVRRPAGPRR